MESDDILTIASRSILLSRRWVSPPTHSPRTLLSSTYQLPSLKHISCTWISLSITCFLRIGENGCCGCRVCSTFVCHESNRCVVFRRYGLAPGEGVVAFVVQPGERNVVDQRWLEMKLWMDHGVRVKRVTLAQIQSSASVDDQGEPLWILIAWSAHPVTIQLLSHLESVCVVPIIQ